MNDDIKVVCKRCGRPAKASEFVLDPDYRMMVCQACSKERLSQSIKTKKQESVVKQKEEEKAKEAETFKNKPAGWDEDDERLEKMSKAKASEGPSKQNYERIDDDNIKLTCPKCEYKFTYNTVRMTPNACPYCGVKLNIKVR